MQTIEMCILDLFWDWKFYFNYSTFGSKFMVTSYNIEVFHLTKKKVGACWTLEPTILPPIEVSFPKFPNLHLHWFYYNDAKFIVNTYIIFCKM